jgi:carbonic anhydrase
MRVATSPTTLTLRHLREQGWPLVAIVEHWNPHARIRQDLFGFVDVLAVGPAGVLAVQTTSAANVAARVTKIAESPNVAAVREAGIAIHVHGWAKKAGRWTLQRDVDVS